MSVKKIYKALLFTFALCIIASVLLVRYAANWLSNSSVELGTLRTQVTELEKQWTDLERAKKILAEQSDDVTTLSYVLPKDKDQARVVKELYTIAEKANVQIDSVGFPSSTLGAAPKPAPTPPTTDSATPTTDTTTTPSTPTPTPAAPKSVSQATPVKEIPGVQAIELSIGAITSKDPSIKGIRYDEMIDLLKLIERNRRTMQIRSIGIGQTQNAGPAPTYDLTLSIVIFIKP